MTTMVVYKKKSKRAYRKRRVSKKKASGRKVATRAYVKKILHREVENKSFISFGSGQLIKVQVNSAPTLGDGFISLIPPVGLGNSSSARIGNKIKVLSSTLRLVFTMAPYNAVTNPYVPGVWVKIWIFRFKNANDRTPTTGEWQSFFKGNGSNIPFQGSQLDLTFPVETDIFDIKYTKTIWLTSTSNSANTVPNATSYGFATGKNSVMVNFNLTKHLGSLIYNDTVTSSVQGKNLYMVCQPIYSQQNVSTANNFAPVLYTYTQTSIYEDA